MSADRPTASFVDATLTHDPNATRTGDANATAPISPPAPPDGAPIVPGYDVLGELDRGGMGVVYRAREVTLDRDVAIKVLQDRYAPDSLTARRFVEEARITAQLQHPAIPPVHHVGRLADGRPFLAMKLIKGDTLADLLAAEPSNRLRHVPAFLQVCQAVAYAHAHKVIHRDLKPQNIMVGAFGEVQVMDWGLAKVLGVSREAQPSAEADASTEIHTQRDGDLVTQAGSILGTPAFMAPEQAQGAVAEIDERSDVFGLGAVLCVILTGQPPYTGPNSDSVRLKAIRGETAEALRRLDACGADPELVALCRRCLATDRSARPQDADEVAKAVAALLAAAEERARQAELEQVRAAGELAKAEAETREQRKRRRVQRVLAGTVVLVLALAAAGAGLAFYLHEAEAANKQLAEEQTRTEAARAQAETERDAAEEARGTLRTALGELGNTHAELQKERDRLAAVEYGRTMEVAQQEWRDGNVTAAVALLNGTRADLRGWEWHYLHRLCHSDLLTLVGHTGDVRSASFSPDGLRVVTASLDGTTKVWDARSGAELVAMKGTGVDAYTASFSPDGLRIVTGSRRGTVQVWDASTGSLVFHLRGHTGYVFSASYCAAGTRILTVSLEDLTARVWDATTGIEVVCIKEDAKDMWNPKGVEGAAISPDGIRLVTLHRGDYGARVWDLTTKANVFTLTGHSGPVRTASFSADGKRIVTGSRDRTARVWDAKRGTLLATLTGHTAEVSHASFSPDGSRVVTASADRRAKVYDLLTGTEVVTLKGHTGDVSVASFSSDGDRIVTGGADRTARVWDAQTGTELLALRGHSDTVWHASFSPDGTRVVTGGGGTVRIWDAIQGADVVVRPLAQYLGTVAHPDCYSPDGNRIVVEEVLGVARVLDVKSGARVLTLKGPTGVYMGWSGSFSPDGTRILTAVYGRVKVWDARSGDEVFDLSARQPAVDSGSFSPDGSRIVTGGRDGAVRVWDSKTGAELLTFRGHTEVVTRPSYSRDGTRVVAGSFDGTVKVWDATTAIELLTLKGHMSSVFSASFSPDGARIVSGSGDGTAKVWDARTGACVLTLKGHSFLVRGVQEAWFSQDGTQIVTIGKDKTARLWDSRPFRETRPPDPEVAPLPRAAGR